MLDNKIFTAKTPAVPYASGARAACLTVPPTETSYKSRTQEQDEKRKENKQERKYTSAGFSGRGS